MLGGCARHRGVTGGIVGIPSFPDEDFVGFRARKRYGRPSMAARLANTSLPGCLPFDHSVTHLRQVSLWLFASPLRKLQIVWSNCGSTTCQALPQSLSPRFAISDRVFEMWASMVV